MEESPSHLDLKSRLLISPMSRQLRGSIKKSVMAKVDAITNTPEDGVFMEDERKFRKLVYV